MRSLSQAARDVYRDIYPIGPTKGSMALSQWMKTSGLTMRDIAGKIGCTEATLRSWAHGRRVPTIEFARRLELLVGAPIVAWVQRSEDFSIDSAKSP